AFWYAVRHGTRAAADEDPHGRRDRALGGGDPGRGARRPPAPGAAAADPPAGRDDLVCHPRGVDQRDPRVGRQPQAHPGGGGRQPGEHLRRPRRMNVLLDTNVLARAAQPAHSHYAVARSALAALVGKGDTPCLVPQVLYELWAVATRPLSANGLGLAPAQADAELSRLE